jgi:hypothetical protein
MSEVPASPIQTEKAIRYEENSRYVTGYLDNTMVLIVRKDCLDLLRKDLL